MFNGNIAAFKITVQLSDGAGQVTFEYYGKPLSALPPEDKKYIEDLLKIFIVEKE